MHVTSNTITEFCSQHSHFCCVWKLHKYICFIHIIFFQAFIHSFFPWVSLTLLIRRSSNQNHLSEKETRMVYAVIKHQSSSYSTHKHNPAKQKKISYIPRALWYFFLDGSLCTSILPWAQLIKTTNVWCKKFENWLQEKKLPHHYMPWHAFWLQRYQSMSGNPPSFCNNILITTLYALVIKNLKLVRKAKIYFFYI